MKKITPFKVKDYSIIKSRDDFYKGIMRQYGFEYFYDGFPLTATHIGSTELLGAPGITNNTVVNNTYVTNTNNFYNDYRSLNLSLTEVQKTLKSFGAEFGALSGLSHRMTTVSGALEFVKSIASGRENGGYREGAAAAGSKKKIEPAGSIANGALSKAAMGKGRLNLDFAAANGLAAIRGRRASAGAKKDSAQAASPVYKYENKYPAAFERAFPGYIKYKSIGVLNSFLELTHTNRFFGEETPLRRARSIPGAYSQSRESAQPGDSFFIPVSVRYGMAAVYGAQKPGVVLKGAADYGRTLFEEQIRNISRQTERYIRTMRPRVAAVQNPERAAESFEAAGKAPNKPNFESAALLGKAAAEGRAEEIGASGKTIPAPGPAPGKRPGKGEILKPGMKASEINKIISEACGMDIKTVPKREKSIIREVLESEFANSVLILEKEKLSEIFREVFDIKTVSEKEAVKKILRERITREIIEYNGENMLSEIPSLGKEYVSVRETRYLKSGENPSGAYGAAGEAGYAEALRLLSRRFSGYIKATGSGAATGPYGGMPALAADFGTDLEGAEEFMFSILPAEIRYKTQSEFQLLTPEQKASAVWTLYRSVMKTSPYAGEPQKIKGTQEAPIQMKPAGVRVKTERFEETAGGGSKGEEREVTETRSGDVILNKTAGTNTGDIGTKEKSGQAKPVPAASFPSGFPPEKDGGEPIQINAHSERVISEAIEYMARQVKEFSRKNAEIIAEKGFLPSVLPKDEPGDVLGFHEPIRMFFPAEMVLGKKVRRNAGGSIPGDIAGISGIKGITGITVIKGITGITVIKGINDIKGIKDPGWEPEHIAKLSEKAGEAHKGILNGISKTLKTSVMPWIRDGGTGQGDSGESFFLKSDLRKSGLFNVRENLFGGAVTALLKSGLIGRAAAIKGFGVAKAGAGRLYGPSEKPGAGGAKEGVSPQPPGIETQDASIGIFIPPLLEQYRPGAFPPRGKTKSGISAHPAKAFLPDLAQEEPGGKSPEYAAEFFRRAFIKYWSDKSAESFGKADGAAYAPAEAAPLKLAHKKERAYPGPGERRENINAAAPEFMEDKQSYPDIEFISGDANKAGGPVFTLIKDGKKNIKQEPAKRLLDMVTEDDINELTEELAENIMEMLSKDLGGIAELVYGIIEDKLRLEKQIRGIF